MRNKTRLFHLKIERNVFMVIYKSEMIVEDVKLQFITPAIFAKKYRLAEKGDFSRGEQLV